MKSYADVSYSYGSFNTHKTSINTGYTTASGFKFQLNAFRITQTITIQNGRCCFSGKYFRNQK
ncbi:hypothetical protein CS542_07000 [Pedobacter sp. IW39]|nr:hypothetical protein CS542_07000 [Pedobacter sp. IW39]